MQDRNFFSVLFFSLCFTFSIYATPVSIVQSSVELGTASFQFEGDPYVSVRDGVCKGYLNELMTTDPFYDNEIFFRGKGFYELSTSESYIATDIQDSKLTESILFSPSQSIHTGAETDVIFSKIFEVNNLKRVNFEFLWTGSYFLSTNELNEYATAKIETDLSICDYTPEGGAKYLTSTSSGFTVSTNDGKDLSSSMGRTIRLGYTFDSPFNGFLEMGNVFNVSAYAGTSAPHSVPEPNSVNFVLPALAMFFGLRVLRNKNKKLC